MQENQTHLNGLERKKTDQIVQAGDDSGKRYAALSHKRVTQKGYSHAPLPCSESFTEHLREIVRDIYPGKVQNP